MVHKLNARFGGRMCSSVCVFRIGQVQFLIFLRSNYIFLPMAQPPLVGQGLLIMEASRSHSDTPH